METSKVLAALLANPGCTSREIAELAGANRNTVETVLQRVRHALTREQAPASSGRRGRPETRYAVNLEWAPLLKERWAIGADEKTVSPLETSLSALEASSFAAIDPIEPPDEQARMADLARLQARTARALARNIGDAALEAQAIQRIDRAEARMRPLTDEWPDVAAGPKFGNEDIRERLLVQWREWVSKLVGLTKRYGCKTSGAADSNMRGLALVLDLIPEAEDPVEAAIMRVLDRIQKPAICVHVAALTPQRQGLFLRDFEQLALDPIARFAELYAAVDSERAPSTRIWAEIDSMARGAHADRIVEIAGASLRSALVGPGLGSQTVRGVSGFYADFLSQVESARTSSGADASLWRIYGSPAVLDLHESAAFRDRVVGRNWSYLGSAASSDLDEIARTEFSLTA